MYRIVVQTACEAFAGTDAYLELQLIDAEGRSYRTGYLDSPGKDLAQCTQDVYDLGTGQWVDLSTTAVQVYFRSTSLIWGEWRPAWIQVGGLGAARGLLCLVPGLLLSAAAAAAPAAPCRCCGYCLPGFAFITSPSQALHPLSLLRCAGRPEPRHQPGGQQELLHRRLPHHRGVVRLLAVLSPAQAAGQPPLIPAWG